jgi:hypothetical protein
MGKLLNNSLCNSSITRSYSSSGYKSFCCSAKTRLTHEREKVNKSGVVKTRLACCTDYIINTTIKTILHVLMTKNMIYVFSFHSFHVCAQGNGKSIKKPRLLQAPAMWPCAHGDYSDPCRAISRAAMHQLKYVSTSTSKDVDCDFTFLFIDGLYQSLSWVLLKFQTQ